MIGRNPHRERHFIFEAERDKAPDERMVCVHRLLTAAEYAEVQDNVVEVRGSMKVEDQRTTFRTGSQVIKAIKKGLLRFENFADEDGATINWPKEGSDAQKDHALSYLTPAQRRELANAIMGESELTEEQAKNSDAPSGSRGPGGATAVTTASVSAA